MNRTTANTAPAANVDQQELIGLQVSEGVMLYATKQTLKALAAALMLKVRRSRTAKQFRKRA